MNSLNKEVSPNNNKKRVVVAMSGGVDSSVAAALLVEQGYEVVGMMMRLWSEPGTGSASALNRCCTPDQMADARRISEQLKIPFYVIDVKDYFRRTVVQYFIDESTAGKTPNPCIECNRQIRFSYLLNQAIALDADYLATGHYAQVKKEGDSYKLLKSVDHKKDQSYVLHVLNQEKLGRVLFPVGKYHKEDVRKLARKFNLPVASKQDSQDLCFIADGDYRRFLKHHAASEINPGLILNESGEVLGRHSGLPFYTIGQRKGLGVSGSHPVHVIQKDQENNTLLVGSRSKLQKIILTSNSLNWISGKPPEVNSPLQIKIRYKAKAVPGSITAFANKEAEVRFDEPVFGITPGQGVVFYDNDVCLGGGLIIES